MKQSENDSENRISVSYNRYYRVIVGLLFLAALFLRFYRLGEVPRGLHADEAGMAYDAWSISRFGVDRYLKSYPLYLTAYGSGQSVMYCYLTALFFKFGLPVNSVVIRLPGVLMSMVTGIFGFLLIRKVRGRNAGILFLIIFLTIPYFTQSSRVALDCNLMLGMTVVMLYIMEKCLDPLKEQTVPCFLLLGIVTGLTFYTYALSYMVLPVFYAVLLVILLICKYKLKYRCIIAFLIPVIILAIPLVLVQIVNIFELDEIKILNMTFTKLIFYRGNELSLRDIRDNIGWIYRSLFKADNTEFDTFPQFGAVYRFSLPLIVLGMIITAVRFVRDTLKGKMLYDGIILLYMSVVFLMALFIQGVTTYRINSVFFALTFFIVVAIEYLITYLPQHIMSKLIGSMIKALGFGLVVAYLVYSAFFMNYYFNVYEDEIYPQRLFAENPTKALDYVVSQGEEISGRLTYVGDVNEAYIYYMLYKHISPYDYDVNKYGNNGDGIKYTFCVRAPYDTNSNYIMYCPEKEETEGFLADGFTEQIIGPYKVYIYRE